MKTSIMRKDSSWQRETAIIPSECFCLFVVILPHTLEFFGAILPITVLEKSRQVVEVLERTPDILHPPDVPRHGD